MFWTQARGEHRGFGATKKRMVQDDTATATSDARGSGGAAAARHESDSILFIDASAKAPAGARAPQFLRPADTGLPVGSSIVHSKITFCGDYERCTGFIHFRLMAFACYEFSSGGIRMLRGRVERWQTKSCIARESSALGFAALAGIPAFVDDAQMPALGPSSPVRTPLRSMDAL